jgi:hypothetical protein
MSGKEPWKSITAHIIFYPLYIRMFPLQFSYVFDDKSINFDIQPPKCFYTSPFEFDYVSVQFSKFDWFDDFLQALWPAIKGS